MVTPLASYELATGLEDLSDSLSILAERETPFLNIVMNNTLAATAQTHEWVNVKLSGNKGTAVGNFLVGDTTITLSGESATGIPNKYFIYQVIRMNGEDIRITGSAVANGANWDVPVERGFRGTTASAITSGDAFRAVGRVLPENYKPANASEHEFGTKDSNYTQILGGQVELGATAVAVNVAGRDNSMAVQKERTLTKLMKELESSVIQNGAKFQDGSGDNRSFAGLIGFLPNSNTAVSTDKSAATLSADDIEVAVDNIYSVGGKVNMIMCNNFQKRKLNLLMDAKTNSANPMSTRTFERVTSVFGTQHGDIPVMLSYDVPEDTVLLLDTDKIAVVPLQRRAFSSKVQGAKGMVEEEYIEGEYTVELRNPESHHRLYNLATS